MLIDQLWNVANICLQLPNIDLYQENIQIKF